MAVDVYLHAYQPSVKLFMLGCWRLHVGEGRTGMWKPAIGQMYYGKKNIFTRLMRSREAEALPI